MLDGIKEYLFLVVDNDSSGILTNCVSASCANAVSRGILNSSVMVIKFSFMRNNHEINRYQDNNQLNFKLIRLYDPEELKKKLINWKGEANNYQYQESKNPAVAFDIVPLDQKHLTEDWLNKRKICNLRSRHLRNLETMCERYVARTKTFFSDEIFLQYLATQLPLVQQNKDQYPESIKEWAETRSMSNGAAYNELKMMYESSGIVIMRAHAIWHKYVDLINSLETEEDLKSIYARIETELIHGER